MARFQMIVAYVFLALLNFSENVLAASAGCGKAPTMTSGTKSISVGGQNRQYIIKLPDNYDRSRPYRLIFGLHWRGGTMTDVATGQTVQRDVWSYYGLQRLANNSAIFIAPQGNGNGWANSNGADVNFIDAIIKTVEADLCVNEKLRFTTGFSYGAAMSYSLACARPDTFRAVGVLSGGVLSGCSGSSKPVAYYGQHGISDSVLGISGGRSMRDRFVQANGCTKQNAATVQQGSRKHATTSYSGCKAGYPVTWTEFDEGHIPAPYDGSAGESGTKTFTAVEMWKFFSQFT